MALLIDLAPQPHYNHNIPDDVLIEDRETEYVGIILEDRTVIIESFNVDDDVDRTISKINDKKVIGFVHELDDDEVPADEILRAFDRR